MNRILVVGSVGYDTITAPKGRAENVVGGSANYFSLAASLYSPVNVVGVVGQDYHESDFEILLSRNVDLTGLKIADGETFRWAGSYVEDLNEAVTLKTELNVFRHFDPVLPEAYRDCEYLFLANIDPVLQMKVLDQVKSPKCVGLDTMNYWIDSKIEDLRKVLARVDVFLLNEKEAMKLTGADNIVLATKTLMAMGPKVVVVKRGEYGFFMLAKDGEDKNAEQRFFVLPAYPVADVVDPTGAGDSFAGGFFGYLSRNGSMSNFRNLQEACIHGSVIASFVVQDFSVRALTALDWSKVERRLGDYNKIVSLKA